MSIYDLIEIAFFLGILIILTPLLGKYMAKVFAGEDFKLKKWLHWLENLISKTCGVRTDEQMTWKEYTFALLTFNFFGFVVVFIVQLVQKWLPLNPQYLENVNPALAFNTAVSYMTNTNWQSYAGETTLSYLVQMLGLTVQNFLSAATGIAVLLVLIRSLKNRLSADLGSFWVDLIRSIVYLLLPLSIILAVLLVSQGVVQTFQNYTEITTLEGTKQTLAVGPAASQIAIKQLGTNGGGFFNANSAHPFENPTLLSNFFEMLAILLIPASLTYTFGKMVNSVRQGWILFFTMLILFITTLSILLLSEFSYNNVFGVSGIMEGKEFRFGITNSVLWADATSSASNGSVNTMHSSLSPLAGGVTIFNMMLGEIIFGGVGAGLYGMLLFVILTVFIAGLLVGRTPEYLGKKIDAFEVKMAIIGIFAPGFVILVFTAISVLTPAGLTSILNSGPHGFSEILYAFSSAAGNNGSAFAGLNANTTYYNILMGIGMLIGRFSVIVPVLAIAGSLAAKRIIPPSAGTFRTDTGLFIFLLLSIIIIIGALTFLPALSLGPVVEHFLMISGQTF